MLEENPLRLMSDIQLLEVASSLENLTPSEFLLLQEEYIYRNQTKALAITRSFFLEKGMTYFNITPQDIEIMIAQQLEKGLPLNKIHTELYQRGFLEDIPIEENPTETSPQKKSLHPFKKWVMRIGLLFLAYTIAKLLLYFFL